MSERSRRARDIGNTVVRRTTGLVAASCLVGTGAFVAIQAKADTPDGSGGGPPATAPQTTDALVVAAGSRAASPDLRSCVDRDHESDVEGHDDFDDHESDDDHDEHESDDDHDDHDDYESSDERADCAPTFNPPATAPATAPPETTPRVVSGGS